MLVKAWRFITIILASLSMAMAFCHLLEMPPRLGWDASLWVGATVTGNVFRLFGTVGAVIETGAWIAAVVLAFLLRRHGPTAFRLTVAGAVLFVSAFVAWWVFVFPVNTEIANWTVETVPADWTEWRAQWEYAHAARAVLQLLGLGALVLSVVVETPSEDRLRDRASWSGHRAPVDRAG
jgi:Anthrone oxygenase